MGPGRRGSEGRVGGSARKGAVRTNGRSGEVWGHGGRWGQNGCGGSRGARARERVHVGPPGAHPVVTGPVRQQCAARGRLRGQHARGVRFNCPVPTNPTSAPTAPYPPLKPDLTRDGGRRTVSNSAGRGLRVGTNRSRLWVPNGAPHARRGAPLRPGGVGLVVGKFAMETPAPHRGPPGRPPRQNSAFWGPTGGYGYVGESPPICTRFGGRASRTGPWKREHDW